MVEQGPHAGGSVGLQGEGEEREGEVEGEEGEEVVEEEEVEDGDGEEEEDRVEGQGGRSQSSVCVSSPSQSSPPFRACCRTFLVLVLVAAPQLVEHWDHTE